MVNLKRHKDFKYKYLLIRVTHSMNDNMQVKEMRGYTTDGMMHKPNHRDN